MLIRFLKIEKNENRYPLIIKGARQIGNNVKLEIM